MLVSSPKIEVKIILISVKTMRVNKKKRKWGGGMVQKRKYGLNDVCRVLHKVENKTKIFL